MDTGYHNFYEKKFKLLLMLLGSITFILGGCFLVENVDPFYRLVGYISIIFFGLCFIKACFKLFTSKPYIEITPAHIRIDNFEKLLWSDVTKAQEMKIKQSSFLYLDVKDVSKYKLTFWQKINLHSGFSPFYITLTALSQKDAEELRRILKERAPENNLD